jgi:hypothetical protein
MGTSLKRCTSSKLTAKYIGIRKNMYDIIQPFKTRGKERTKIEI